MSLLNSFNYYTVKKLINRIRLGIKNNNSRDFMKC